MDIPVLVERVAGNGFRARAGEPLAMSADGATREEALGKLRALTHARLASGAEITALTVPDKDNPWLRLIGTLDANDPLVQEWEQEIANYRQQVEDDPNCP